MNSKKQQEHLLTIMDVALADGGAHRLIIGERNPNPPAGAAFQHWSRIVFVITGNVGVELPQGEERVRLKQSAGCGMFFPPYAWNAKVPPFHGECLGLVFREACTRFVYSDRHCEQAPFVISNSYYHTAMPLSSPGRQVLEALQHLAEEGGDRTTGLLLLNALLRLCRAELANDNPGTATKASYTFKRVCYYLEEHFHEPVNRETTARELRVHPNYLSRIFKENSGRTFSEYLRKLRLEHAARLLSMGSLDVGEVAAHSGFGDLTHFYRTFRKMYGMSPGRYRRRNEPHSQRTRN